MALLRKMGWKDGEGLGKNNEGTTQPLVLEFKMDRKGDPHDQCLSFIVISTNFSDCDTATLQAAFELVYDIFYIKIV